VRFEKPDQTNNPLLQSRPLKLGSLSFPLQAFRRIFPACLTSRRPRNPLMYFPDFNISNRDSLSHTCEASDNIFLTQALVLSQAYLFPVL